MISKFEATCGVCGKTPSIQCREHFVARIAELESALGGREQDLSALSEINRDLRLGTSRLDAEVARLNAVACEWEPMTIVELGGIDFRHKKGGVIHLSVKDITQVDAGRLAATLAHFARTGELPC